MTKRVVPVHVWAPESHFSCFNRTRVNHWSILGPGILMHLLTGVQCRRLGHTIIEASLGQRGRLN
jgi:hypothetical protein